MVSAPTFRYSSSPNISSPHQLASVFPDQTDTPLYLDWVMKFKVHSPTSVATAITTPAAQSTHSNPVAAWPSNFTFGVPATPHRELGLILSLNFSTRPLMESRVRNGSASIK
ncbi:Monoamine oxidase N [Fusarium oxysporum f. sp. albedinis]|nr:Monoamine oxidase N [Fusarium oxysporum f. sp. albedinis]